MKVVIGGVEIPVVLRTAKSMPELMGVFHSSEEEIHLSKGLAVRLRRKTLVHEVLHAYLHISGFSELLPGIDENLEEAMCRSFEQAMGHLFKFDKDLEDWLKGV